MSQDNQASKQISISERMLAWVLRMDEGFIYPSDRDLWLSAEDEYDLRHTMEGGRKEIERLRASLERYGHHTHPNCHDLTLNDDGSFGPRNGCLCGFDAARGAHETEGNAK